jgi:hypothetical protein
MTKHRFKCRPVVIHGPLVAFVLKTQVSLVTAPKLHLS